MLLRDLLEAMDGSTEQKAIMQSLMRARKMAKASSTRDLDDHIEIMFNGVRKSVPSLDVETPEGYNQAWITSTLIPALEKLMK